MPDPTPAKRLTDLELEIMQLVWDAHPAAMTVRDVLDRLVADGRDLAYTTVQTMMTILKKKGVLESRPGPGRAHEYSAQVSRKEARTSMTEDFLARLFRGDASPPVAHLLNHDSMSREELEELRRRIDTQLSDEEEV